MNHNIILILQSNLNWVISMLHKYMYTHIVTAPVNQLQCHYPKLSTISAIIDDAQTLLQSHLNWVQSATQVHTQPLSLSISRYLNLSTISGIIDDA